MLTQLEWRKAKSAMNSGAPRHGPVVGGRPHAEESAVRRAFTLLGQALASDDAEAAGLHADDVLADQRRAQALLGGPDAWEAARHAVVQRYGRVGALLVIGYEDRAQPGTTARTLPALERLMNRFPSLDAEQVHVLLEEIDSEVGTGIGGESVSARRWLHATYAVAERDGTEPAHRAYMQALDRVMRLARPVIAS
ncbi:MAG TPA: hypothetical protein VMV14_00860 [Acidimicrobiales bacterium]|nr:hypothetical protein [Acidimicrobiales bacterium]